MVKADAGVSVVYYAKRGPVNTERTLELARERAKQLRIEDIVIASTHGATALKAAKTFRGMKVNLIAVTLSEGFKEEGWVMTLEERRKVEAKGIKVLTCSHSLGDGVAASFADKHGGKSTEQVVAETLYRLGQGMKVAVEIAMMAADAGLIGVNREMIAIAGSSEGADTAIVVKPAHPRRFHQFEIREVLAKPRYP